MVATIGLIVNPAAGRDIRRLVGGASVRDNYAKRRTAACVLAGVAGTAPEVAVRVMPDEANLGQRIVGDAPDGLVVDLLEMPIRGDARDTRRAAAQFADDADAVVVLGGDGTTGDVATAAGETPLVSISTGTNNVVPTAVDGTVAGVAAGLVAADAVPAERVTTVHTTVEASVADRSGDRRVSGLATVGVLDRPFIGARAILDPTEYVAGMASRAAADEIGLSGVAGALTALDPADPGGVGMRFDSPETGRLVASAVTVPGRVSRIGVTDWETLTGDDALVVEVDQAVVTADGERELEVREGTVELRPRDTGPRLVDIEAALAAAAETGRFATTRE
ncbi:NAD(+)/NADH kinase [Haloferacaceae archaeon DSL9]